MKAHATPLIGWIGCAVVAGLAGCTSGGRAPSTPPTFVLAWIAPGGQVSTVESRDGTTWFRNYLRRHATTSEGAIGPAIAHDRALSWMLMWANGPELQYVVGLGGNTATAGIRWDQTPTVGVLPAMTDASPALAYGGGRWVVVFRRAGGGLFVARTAAGSATSWTAPVSVTPGGPTAPQAVTSRAPALVCTTLGGREVFVLAFVAPGGTAVASTSLDGLTWTPPVPIGLCEKDPALAAIGGRVLALLSRQVSATGAASGFHGKIFSSANGTTWSPIASYPGAANNVTGASMAYNGTRLVIAEQIGGALGGPFFGISTRIGTPSGPGSNPTGFMIGPDVALNPEIALTTPERVGNSGARTALAFGGPALGGPVARKLIITEWFPNAVELYLDEPAGTTLDLTGIALEVRARVDLDPNVDEPDHQARVELFGTIRGGEFLVVFEGYQYSGDPVAEIYTDAPYIGGNVHAPGIKVRDNFFGWNFGGTSTSLRVFGTSSGGLVDDVVKLGSRPRPAIGGTFQEDTPAEVPLPWAPNTLGRLWGPSGPLDNDRESDWRAGTRTFGEPPQ